MTPAGETVTGVTPALAAADHRTLQLIEETL